MTFNLDKAKKLVEKRATLKNLVERFPTPDLDFEDEDDIQEAADYARMDVDAYVKMTKNIRKASRQAENDYLDLDHSLFGEDGYPQEWLVLTTQKFDFDESKAIELAKEHC